MQIYVFIHTIKELVLGINVFFFFFLIRCVFFTIERHNENSILGILHVFIFCSFIITHRIS